MSRGRPSWPAATPLLAVMLLVALGACRPLYVPLVPDDAPEPVQRTRLRDNSTLTAEGGRPLLTLEVAEVAPGAAEGDWLAVQWYGPSGALAASESRWVDAGSVGAELTFELPPDVATAPGEWRAVVSLGGFVLRQFRVDVSIDPEPAG